MSVPPAPDNADHPLAHIDLTPALRYMETYGLDEMRLTIKAMLDEGAEADPGAVMTTVIEQTTLFEDEQPSEFGIGGWFLVADVD